MYYAHFILNKKGPLAKIWLAAHWDKKLTKAQIYETNIESTIETILEPQMKLALRTSGHLLLGVCRIYSRKVKYLLADCNEAFVKIKLAFRPGLIDLPKEKQQASVDAITLPEKFPDFYVNFDDINIEDMDMTKNIAQQARVEDITLKEDFGTFVTMQDDDFGDMGSFGMAMDMDSFMMSDMEKGRRFGESLVNNDQNEIDFFDDRLNNQSDFTSGLQDLSKQNANNLDDIQPMELAEINNDLTENTIAEKSAFNTSLSLENQQATNNIAQEDTIMQDYQEHENNEIGLTTVEGQPGVVPTLFDDQPTVNATNLNEQEGKSPEKVDEILNEEAIQEEKVPENEQDNEDKSLNIDSITDNNKNHEKIQDEVTPAITVPTTTDTDSAPVSSIAPAVVEKQIKTKRRRKLIIDDIKEIDSSTMKSQLSDTTGISGSLELAPPTRKLMQWKETGGVDKLFSMTSRPLHNKALHKLYSRNMITKSLVDITNISKLDKINQSTREVVLSAPNPMSTSAIVNNVSIANIDVSVEASMNDDNQTSKNLLPLADSFIDNNNDESKRQQIPDISIDMNALDAPVQTELQNETVVEIQSEIHREQSELQQNESTDQLAAPVSMFTSNPNLDDTLMNDYQVNPVNLEITPVKVSEDKNEELKEKESEESEEDEKEEAGENVIAEKEKEDKVDGQKVGPDEIKKTSRASKSTSPNAKKRQSRKSMNATFSRDITIREDPEDFDETLTNDPAKNLTKRAKTMVSILSKSFNKNDNVGFFEVIKRNGRKSAVQKFYSLLVLSKYEIIEVSQEEQYDDIIISKGEKFESFAH